MISQALKEQTKENHQQLEAVVVRQIKSIRSQQDYLRLLTKFYGYYFPLEQRFDTQLNDTIVPFYTKRKKSGLLLNDLRSLQADHAIPGLASDIPRIDSRARALGSFYVLEGSSQGGDIVADILYKYAQLEPAHTSFFRVYGEEKKTMWLSFVGELNKMDDSENFRNQLVEAANETFSKFRDWMQKD